MRASGSGDTCLDFALEFCADATGDIGVAHAHRIRVAVVGLPPAVVWLVVGCSMLP